jgi:hypothetical protein
VKRKRYQCKYCLNKFKNVKKFVAHLAEKHGVDVNGIMLLGTDVFLVR